MRERGPSAVLIGIVNARGLRRDLTNYTTQLLASSFKRGALDRVRSCMGGRVLAIKRRRKESGG